MDEEQNIEKEELMKLSKIELIERITSLSAKNQQLQNILKGDKKTVVKVASKSYNFEKCVFRHVLIKFLYLGWNYDGFTVQQDSNKTIEHYLFEALTKTCLIKTRADSRYHRCGRTDKGVSAFNQVISINIRSKLTVENQHKLDEEIDYCATLNKVLPDNIQCIAWSPVEPDFSARFSCKGRTYKYFFPKGQLDIERMRACSKYLVGTHDFRNFCRMDVKNGVTQFVRNITEMDICLFDKTEHIDEYSMYVLTISGKAFLWHQIRHIMGILFLVGECKEQPELVQELLDIDNNPRKPDYSMASEVPLNLYNSLYEDDCVNWQYNDDVLNWVIKNLGRIYTFNVTQSTMIKAMINDIQLVTKNKSSTICSEFLMQGVKRKVYTPVMKRMRCESLEQKIKNFAKRKKLEVM